MVILEFRRVGPTTAGAGVGAGHGTGVEPGTWPGNPRAGRHKVVVPKLRLGVEYRLPAAVSVISTSALVRGFATHNKANHAAVGQATIPG